VHNEFSLIDVFTGCFPRLKPPLGPGDDCAVLPVSQHELCVTTDAVVENVHFTRKHFSPGDIGHKALAVNLSDLAAMGAEPSWFVCSLELPRATQAAEVRALGKGMAQLAKAAGIRLVGGNISAGPVLSLTLTVAGEVPPGKALLREGGRPGEVLFVSGTLGAAARGLSLLGRQNLTPPEKRAAGRQRRPLPRNVLGRLARDYASACIDLSDGLNPDLGHLCKASHVGARLSLEALPLDASLAQLPLEQRLKLALTGGEDYELLCAVPTQKAQAFQRACDRAGQRVTRVGELIQEAGVRLEGAGGQRLQGLPGFDHFRGTGNRRS